MTRSFNVGQSGEMKQKRREKIEAYQEQMRLSNRREVKKYWFKKIVNLFKNSRMNDEILEIIFRLEARERDIRNGKQTKREQENG